MNLVSVITVKLAPVDRCGMQQLCIVSLVDEKGTMKCTGGAEVYRRRWKRGDIIIRRAHSWPALLWPLLRQTLSWQT